MNIRIIGNDIEIDGEKVARIFDVRATLKDRLSDAIDMAAAYEPMQEHKNSEIEDAYEKGFEKGLQEGYEQREAEEQNTN